MTTLSASVHEWSVGRRASGFVQVGQRPPMRLATATWPMNALLVEVKTCHGNITQAETDGSCRTPGERPPGKCKHSVTVACSARRSTGGFPGVLANAD